MLDADPAALYGVTTKVLNQAVCLTGSFQSLTVAPKMVQWP
jgi:hypothetical protein